LIVTLAQRHGEEIAIIKDPLAHRFFEMPARDWRVAGALDPALPLAAQVARVRDALPDALAAEDDRAVARRILRVSAELKRHGLAAGGTTGPRRTSPLRRLLHGVSSVLFLRLRLFNPDPLLRAATPLCAWLLHPVGLVTLGVLIAVSTVAFFAGGATTGFQPDWLARPAAWLGLYVGILGLKFVHEMSHAAVVRHFGGRVHECGALLVAGLPLFYVEASDSYLFPRRRQRIAVAAAGIVAELGVAALLVWPWLFAAPGFFRDLLLALIVLASVQTVLFNANPLMRFDGYYILADLLDIPDLRGRSRAFCLGTLKKWLTGSTPAGLPQDRPWVYGLYGPASMAYLVVIVFSIWRWVSGVLEPLDLKWLGHLVVGAWAAQAIVLPTLGFATELVRSLGPTARTRRAWLSLAAIAGFGAAAVWVPIPRAVERPCSLQTAAANAVHAAEPGYLAEVTVQEGDRVAAGQPVAMLRSPTLEAEIAAARAQLAQADARRAAALVARNGAEVEALRAEAAATTARLADLERRADALVLRAPIAGIVATQDLSLRKGHRLDAGETFCVVRPQGRGEFLIPLDEKSARLIHRGARVVLRTTAFPDERYTGLVVADPLSAGTPAVTAGNPPPDQATHFARVQIDDPSDRLRPGATGRVRVDCGTTTVAAATIEAVMDFVRLDVRLR
jgi:putative peptide zinc metalloprotease protein